MMLTIFLPKGKEYDGFLKAEKAYEVKTKGNSTFERKFRGDTEFLLVPAGNGYRIWIGDAYAGGLETPTKETNEGEYIELLAMYPGRHVTFVL